MMFKHRKNSENNIFWNALHNIGEKGLIDNILIHLWMDTGQSEANLIPPFNNE